jgi:hypothetical protein
MKFWLKNGIENDTSEKEIGEVPFQPGLKLNEQIPRGRGRIKIASGLNACQDTIERFRTAT